MSKSIPIMILALLGFSFLLSQVAAGQSGGAADFPSRPVLDDYLNWASRMDPGLSGLRYETEALEQEARQAGSLPDLKLGYGEMLVPVETRVGPQQRAFSVAQPIPWFGTLGLREQVVLDKAAAQEHKRRASELELHRELRNTWYRLALVQQEKRLIKGHLELVGQLNDVLRSSYEAGQADFSRLLQAQKERDKLKVQLANLSDREIQLAADLARLASAPLPVESPRAELVSLGLPWSGLPEIDFLTDLQHRHHPALQGLASDIQSAHSARKLADKEGWPGLTIGLDYIMTGEAADPSQPDSGQDPVIARVGLSLPIWGGKTEARKQGAASRIGQVQSRFDDRRRQLARQLDSTVYQEKAALRRARLYQDDLLPRARQELETISAAYQTGQAEFLDLVASRRQLLDLELAHWQSRHDACVARNDLVTLLGGPAALAEPNPTMTEKMP